MLFQTLHEEKVLPKRPGITPRRKRREIVKNGVSDADVAEIDFLSLAQFVCQVARERRNAPDDEALFQDVQITLDRRTAQTRLAGETVIRHFLPDTLCENVDKVSQTRRISNLRQRKSVLVHDVVDEVHQHFHSVIRIQHVLRKSPVHKKALEIVLHEPPAVLSGELVHGKRP